MTRAAWKSEVHRPSSKALRRTSSLKSEAFGRPTLLISAAVVLVALSCQAIAPDSNKAPDPNNPYHGIIDRNVFALKEMPPPPPPPNPDANKPPPPPIQLTGITTLFGKPRAFLMLTLPAKGPEPAKTLSLMLNENERDGEVEVLTIDVTNRTVLVSNYGSKTNLTFEKPGSSKSSGGSGAAPAMASVAPTHTGFSPGGGFGSKSIPTTVPTRMVRLGGTPNAAGAESSGGGSSAAFTPGSSALTAGGATFTPGSPMQQQPQQPESMENLTPAQKEILMEAAHQAALQKNDPSAAVYPPSFLNPTRNVTPPPTQNPDGTPTVPNPQGGQPPRFFRP
jgi:hypothetical protein